MFRLRPLALALPLVIGSAALLGATRAAAQG
jgi:hypothetical protein